MWAQRELPRLGKTWEGFGLCSLVVSSLFLPLIVDESFEDCLKVYGFCWGSPEFHGLAGLLCSIYTCLGRLRAVDVC